MLASEFTQNYLDYINGSDWKKKRTEFRQHEEQHGRLRCALCPCQDPRKLQAHHRTYVNFKNEDFLDLTLLCSDCHQAYHEGKSRIKTLKKYKAKTELQLAKRQAKAERRMQQQAKVAAKAKHVPDPFSSVMGVLTSFNSYQNRGQWLTGAQMYSDWINWLVSGRKKQMPPSHRKIVSEHKKHFVSCCENMIRNYRERH